MSAEDDAIALVYWYESQPNQATRLTDARIAEKLRWFEGGATTAKDHHRLGSGKFSEPDKARVRKARRFVDRDDLGIFADYQFGTKIGGGGTKWSRLSRKGEHTSDSDEDAWRQIMAGEQMSERFKAEAARVVDKLETLSVEFGNVGEVTKAIACHAAAADYRSDGKLRNETSQLLIDAGLSEWAA